MVGTYAFLEISTIINEYIFKGLKQEQMVHHCFVSIGLVKDIASIFSQPGSFFDPF